MNDFVWYIYTPGVEDFKGVKPSFVSRLMFLATYMNKAGYIVHDNYVPATNVTLQYLLNAGEKTFRIFLKEMIELGYIEKSKGCYRIISDKFAHASCTPSGNAVKIFKKPTRAMYKETQSLSHKRLAYLYKIIPYLNTKCNVLCENPLEEDMSAINNETLLKKIGICGNTTRVINALLGFWFADRYSQERAAFFQIENVINDKLRKSLCLDSQFCCGNDYVGEYNAFLMATE